MTRRGKWAVRGLGLLALIGAAIAARALYLRSLPDRERLQGDWVLTLAVFDGDQIDPAKVQAMGLTVLDDVWEVRVGPSSSGRYRVALAPEKSPKEFDQTKLGPDGEPVLLTVAKGKQEPVVRRGLYQLDGDTLRIVLSREAEKRPTSLEPGEGRLVYVYERIGR